MQPSIYLYCIRSHPTCFGPPTGPSSGVSWAASLCRHLAHAVLQYIRHLSENLKSPTISHKTEAATNSSVDW
jgi:hypothetical protein